MTRELITGAQNTWCPGCGNFVIQHALKDVILRLESEGISRERMVLVTGIGCHAKMADYLDINSFYAIHGRAVPFGTGISMADPDLKVICCVGDGDAYAEGIAHLLFAAKRNVNMTVLVHNNRVYGLTRGQTTPTSPAGYQSISNPDGSAGIALNPPELLLSAGCSFVARGYTGRREGLKELIYDGISHSGFSCIDILQICASYMNKREEYESQVYLPEHHNPEDFEAACRLVRKFSYDDSGEIPLGVIFRVRREIFHAGTPFREQESGDKKSFVMRFIEGRE